MDIVNARKLNVFVKKHSEAGKSVSTWKIVTERAKWQKSQAEYDNIDASTI